MNTDTDRQKNADDYDDTCNGLIVIATKQHTTIRTHLLFDWLKKE